MGTNGRLGGRCTSGARRPADEPEGKQNVQHADSAHHSTKRRVQRDMHERRKVAEKIVFLPECGPRKIEEQSAHLEKKHYQQCAKDSVHGWKRAWTWWLSGWASEELRCARQRRDSRYSSHRPE